MEHLNSWERKAVSRKSPRTMSHDCGSTLHKFSRTVPWWHFACKTLQSFTVYNKIHVDLQAKEKCHFILCAKSFPPWEAVEQFRYFCRRQLCAESPSCSHCLHQLLRQEPENKTKDPLILNRTLMALILVEEPIWTQVKCNNQNKHFIFLFSAKNL